MSGLDSISVKVEGFRENAEMAHNAMPVLHEIRHALAKLRDTSESTTIDLSSIPFGADDRQQLLDALGNGEVSATVDAMGPTRIRETAFPGVWLVQYFDAEERELAAHIQVTLLPPLLATPAADLDDAVLALESRLMDADGKQSLQDP